VTIGTEHSFGTGFGVDTALQLFNGAIIVLAVDFHSLLTLLPSDKPNA
jgi:hypothetical protein